MIDIILLGIGLSMDAFALSITNGLVCKNIRRRDALKIGGAFGFAQGVMPIIGYFLAQTFQKYVEAFDHWIAFALLMFIGGKMIFDVLAPGEEENEIKLDFKSLFIQAVATSIDALAVGISFGTLGMNVYFASSVIAVITFTLCVIGTFVGKFFGSKLGKYAEIAGGLILMGIGAKILIEHLFF